MSATDLIQNSTRFQLVAVGYHLVNTSKHAPIQILMVVCQKKEWYFLLQQVYFNNHYTAKDCPYLGSPKTQPQILKWKATYTLNSNYNPIVVALPVHFHSVLLSTIGAEKKFLVFYEWIETDKKVNFVTRRDGRAILQGISNDVEDDYSRHITPIFPEYDEYKRNEYIVNSSGFIYYIVKYFDTVHNYKYIYEKNIFPPLSKFYP